LCTSISTNQESSTTLPTRAILPPVVVLVIPSTRKVKVFKEFKALTSNWVGAGEEVKERKLDEDQIAQVVALLQRYDVVLEITAIDLGLHTG
jgi:hypothetical protein